MSDISPDIRMDPSAWGVPIGAHQNGMVVSNVAPLLNKDRSARVDTICFGERVKIYAHDGDYVLICTKRDYYHVGWVDKNHVALSDYALVFHNVRERFAPLFSKPDIKSEIKMILPMSSGFTGEDHDEMFYKLTEIEGFIHKSHCVYQELAPYEYALMCLGAPYVWGGGTPDGIDCSGLTQLAHAMAGNGIPRDSDQQERWLPAITKEELRANDLVYWKGHVGMMINEHEMIHATAFAMKTIVEPLAQTIARVGEPTGFRRVE